MAHYQFFQNTSCEYFPCHEGVPKEVFNCLFCYCPLYALKRSCGGDYTYLESGIKSCKHCKKPHDVESYKFIQEHIRAVLTQVKEE